MAKPSYLKPQQTTLIMKRWSTNTHMHTQCGVTTVSFISIHPFKGLLNQSVNQLTGTATEDQTLLMTIIKGGLLKKWSEHCNKS